MSADIHAHFASTVAEGKRFSEKGLYKLAPKKEETQAEEKAKPASRSSSRSGASASSE